MTDAAQLWGAAVVEQVIAMVRGVIIPRILGPGLYGVLGALGLITKYGSYLQMGITTAIGREVPYALRHGESDFAGRLAKVGYSFNLLTSIGPAIILVVYALVSWGSYARATSWGLLAFAVLLITTRFDTYFTTLFRARRQFGSSFWFTAFRAASVFVCTVGLLFVYGVYGVFLGLVISGVTVMVVGSIWTRSWARPWPDWSTIRKLLPVGLPLAVVGALGFVLQSVDRFLVVQFYPARDVGHYFLAVTGVTLVYFIPMNVGQAMAPRIYALRRDGDRREFEEYLVKPSLVLTYLVAAAAGLVVICMVPFIRYVLPAFRPSIPIAAALLVGITCQGGAQGAAHILVALGRFKSLAVAQLVGLVLATAVIFSARHFGWGLTGIAAGSSLGLAAFACSVQFMAWRLMSLPARTFPRAFEYLLVPPVVVAAGLVLAFYGGSFILARLLPGLDRPAVDVANLVVRLVLFTPTVVAFGFYVERETGFVGRIRSLIGEKISPGKR
jgi:O-antigen/teichoic acid export membrane protein